VQYPFLHRAVYPDYRRAVPRRCRPRKSFRCSMGYGGSLWRTAIHRVELRRSPVSARRQILPSGPRRSAAGVVDPHFPYSNIPIPWRFCRGASPSRKSSLA
jgi:hypothetical protein